MMTASCLAVLYGSAAGGVATPAGVPFNPLAISLLEQLTGYQISFAQWTMTGVILMAATLPIYYLVLVWMSPPEVKPGREERAGPGDDSGARHLVRARRSPWSCSSSCRSARARAR
jgi:di/tricarboxylate transporter